MAIRTEAAPLLPTIVSSPWTHDRKLKLELALGVSAVGYGFFSTYDTLTNHERTSIDYTKLFSSLGTLGLGAWISFKSATGLIALKSRSVLALKTADEIPEAQKAHATIKHLNAELDRPLKKYSQAYEMVVPDFSPDLLTSTEQKLTQMEQLLDLIHEDREYFKTEFEKAQQQAEELKITIGGNADESIDAPDNDDESRESGTAELAARGTLVMGTLNALLQKMKAAASSAPSSRGGSRATSRAVTPSVSPFSSPVKTEKTTPRSRGSVPPSPFDLEKGRTPGKKQD